MKETSILRFQLAKKRQHLRHFHPLLQQGRLSSFSGILAAGDYPFLLDGFFGKKRFTGASRENHLSNSL
ncbi:hypothetical protein [uncultured Akkermansia sp.]|uniref:hypothetical protein n=1 Tax=uncultured Akkermansia sp. TaxID=512294 RepID=UPI00265D14B4|nr:hypothetical protein [uncultured Akkermansia sp.]